MSCTRLGGWVDGAVVPSGINAACGLWMCTSSSDVHWLLRSRPFLSIAEWRPWEVPEDYKVGALWVY